MAGPVRAGGIGIVAASDIAIAAEDATFALTEVKLGLAAAIISLTVHHRMNPRAAALTTLGGEVFSGTEAASYGLVTLAVPADELDAEVGRICASLATGAAQGLRESKRILNRDLVARIDAHGDELAALSARLFASDEAREAMTAFLSRKQLSSRATTRRTRVRLDGLPLLRHLAEAAAVGETSGRRDGRVGRRAGRAGDRRRAGVRGPGLRPARGVRARPPRSWPSEGHSRGRLGHEGGLVERDAMVFQAARRIAQLDAAHEGLVFGRLDLRAELDPRAALHRPDRAARRPTATRC